MYGRHKATAKLDKLCDARNEKRGANQAPCKITAGWRGYDICLGSGWKGVHNAKICGNHTKRHRIYHDWCSIHYVEHMMGISVYKCTEKCRTKCRNKANIIMGDEDLYTYVTDAVEFARDSKRVEEYLDSHPGEGYSYTDKDKHAFPIRCAFCGRDLR